MVLNDPFAIALRLRSIDPYHTYLSLAVLAILPADHGEDETWKLARLDPLWNATEDTAQWAREHIPKK